MICYNKLLVPAIAVALIFSKLQHTVRMPPLKVHCDLIRNWSVSMVIGVSKSLANLLMEEHCFKSRQNPGFPSGVKHFPKINHHYLEAHLVRIALMK